MINKKLQPTDKLTNDAPKGWEGAYSCDVGDMRLKDIGSVYADNLTEIVAWLKANGYKLADDATITGTYEGVKTLAMIWYHGAPVEGRPLFKTWDA